MLTKDAAMMGPVAVAMTDMLLDSGREGTGRRIREGSEGSERRKETSSAQVVGAGSKGTRRTLRTGMDKREKRVRPEKE